MTFSTTLCMVSAVFAQVGDGAGVASYGVAGLMGAMWLYERTQSRKRDEQLDAAHKEIIEGRQTIDQLVDVVTANTAAMTTLAATINNNAKQGCTMYTIPKKE